MIGSTVFGLAMFATLFLGAVLAIFLTIGVVRGDAETGLLQPLVVRPLGRGNDARLALGRGGDRRGDLRRSRLHGRLLITLAFGDWSPDHAVVPGVLLALAVMIIAAVSVLASVYMTSTAQGITVFMVFGAGLVAGLLGQIGDALNSRFPREIAEVVNYAVPFEALYQHGLYLLSSDQDGVTGAIVQLGPFGGAQEAGPACSCSRRSTPWRWSRSRSAASAAATSERPRRLQDSAA